MEVIMWGVVVLATAVGVLIYGIVQFLGERKKKGKGTSKKPPLPPEFKKGNPVISVWYDKHRHHKGPTLGCWVAKLNAGDKPFVTDRQKREAIQKLLEHLRFLGWPSTEKDYEIVCRD